MNNQEKMRENKEEDSEEPMKEIEGVIKKVARNPK